MSNGHAESENSQRWEDLYKNVLFEADVNKMPRRIELAKHAVLDRLEDATCAKHKQRLEEGELLALRRAHRTLRALEQLYVAEVARKMSA
jgi:hypothetical protein